MLDLWVSSWHDIHELTEVVDHTVLSCIVRANDGLDKMRPQRGWSARCFFTVTSTTFHSSSALVVNLCMDRVNWFCCLGDCLCVCCQEFLATQPVSLQREKFSRLGTIPIVEGTCLQCRRNERSLVQVGTSFIEIQLFAVSTRKLSAA